MENTDSDFNSVIKFSFDFERLKAILGGNKYDMQLIHTKISEINKLNEGQQSSIEE